MLIIFFVLLLMAALGSMIFGIKYKMWLLTLISTVLFMVLAFQAFQIEVPTGGITLVFHEIVIVYLSWFLAIVSVIFTVRGAISQFRENKRESSG